LGGKNTLSYRSSPVFEPRPDNQSASAFNTAFRRKVGQAPGKYARESFAVPESIVSCEPARDHALVNNGRRLRGGSTIRAVAGF
jgi:hypothetical protein